MLIKLKFKFFNKATLIAADSFESFKAKGKKIVSYYNR